MADTETLTTDEADAVYEAVNEAIKRLSPGDPLHRILKSARRKICYAKVLILEESR